MADSEDKAIRILTFSGKEEDWRMWSAKFMAKARLRGFDTILEGVVIAPSDKNADKDAAKVKDCLLYTSPSPRDS